MVNEPTQWASERAPSTMLLEPPSTQQASGGDQHPSQGGGGSQHDGGSPEDGVWEALLGTQGRAESAQPRGTAAARTLVAPASQAAATAAAATKAAPQARRSSAAEGVLATKTPHIVEQDARSMLPPASQPRTVRGARVKQQG